MNVKLSLTKPHYAFTLRIDILLTELSYTKCSIASKNGCTPGVNWLTHTLHRKYDSGQKVYSTIPLNH